MDRHFKYKYDDLFNPLLSALHKLGGSGSISEIENEVSEIMNLSEDEINEIHRESRTKLQYRLAWSRNYLKKYGLLENSKRGVWSLTEKGQQTLQVDQTEVKRYVAEWDKEHSNKPIQTKAEKKELISDETDEIEDFEWQDKLIQTIREIDPIQFERLCQRLLRELGFVNVEVTQRTNDGGIDGKGLIKIGGVLSFHVVFQAKRYKGSVSSPTIRDFRGAMSGRADKGLILTTGTFTREARKEATRDGAIPIDLIDGTEFAEMLKELNLGVEIEMVEEVKVKTEWFRNI